MLSSTPEVSKNIMTLIAVGSGGSIQSDSAEQQLLDCISLIKNYEKMTTKNPDKVNGVSCSFNLTTSFAAMSFNMAANPIINNDGQQVIQAANYLANTDFLPGSGGTFKSVTIEGYFLEILTYLEIMEKNTSKNPNNNNYVSTSYDSDTRIMAGNATIPFLFENDATGFLKITADEYLLD
jgi:hypothetical protein